jgi:hypothetical protein
MKSIKKVYGIELKIGSHNKLAIVNCELILHAMMAKRLL